MDFEVPDKIKVITGMIDEFVDKEVIPLEPADDAPGPFLDGQ